MRIIECPECRGFGTIDEGYDEWDCRYCHGHGKMNIREWLYLKFVCSELYQKRGCKKLNWLLWKFKEIGEWKTEKE